MRYLVCAAALLLATACSSVEPLPIRAGDTCERCRRTITDTRLAGEMITTTGLAVKFRTVECMAKYLQDHPERVRVVYVTDYPTGRMLIAGNAVFVRKTIDEATKERDYLAFRNLKDAIKAGSDAGFNPIDWLAVRQVVGAATN